MKVLAAILLLILLSIAAYLVMEKGDEVDQPKDQGSSPTTGSEPPRSIAIEVPEFEEDVLPAEDPGQKDFAQIDRSGWAGFRNALERKVPDPDGIGSCPPTHLGGHPAFVVRRFLDRETGDRVWMHEDGSMTLHHYERSKDPGGNVIVGRWMISTAVPAATGRADPGSSR